ncbi:CheY-like chemotaxis protein [Burkholderia sp. 8Y]|uniref:response regulator n=1 Tax=Burkholderia sp. 8Y TaxID=2653133 RepID=UPI0012F24AE4|nr:response regulator [Burkholderia sp. 8Y]VXC90114.1 CheY-like chemotaxis protein [Burkholderia sp. 8Y]
MNDDARKLEGRTIMVVEDDFLVALALSMVLQQAGASIVGPVATAREAVALLEEDNRHIDAAILDVDLNGEKSYPVADALTLRHITFVFATGYGAEALDFPYRQCPRLQKPLDHQALFKALMAS